MVGMFLDQISFIYDSSSKIIEVIVILVVAMLILKILGQVMDKYSTSSLESSRIDTLHKILRYIVFIFVLIALLDVFGVNVQSLFVSLGLLTVALSLAAKDTLSNIISGLVLIIEKRFEVGDMIEIDGQKGIVEKMGLKNVELYYKKEYISVPNVVFTTKSFINYTKYDVYAVKFFIYIRNDHDFNDKLEQVSKVLDKSDEILKQPKYLIFPRDITTHGVKVMIKVYITNPLDDSTIRGNLIRQIKKEVLFEDVM